MKVTRLENERRALEEAETTAEQRREMRKKVLSRTARRWQSLLISSVFYQWKETTQVSVAIDYMRRDIRHRPFAI